MKKFFVSTIALVSATAATAGSVVYTAPDVTIIEEPTRMGGSGAWVVPLIIAAVLAAVLLSKKDSTTTVTNAQQ